MVYWQVNIYRKLQITLGAGLQCYDVNVDTELLSKFCFFYMVYKLLS